jgi:hypothetical protein
MCNSDISWLLSGKDFDDFTNKFGHSDDFAMSDALWLCQSTFSNR